MFTKTKTLWVALMILTAPAMAQAESAASAPAASASSSSDFLQKIKSKTSASYVFQLAGPNLRSVSALSGSTVSNPGTHISILHVFSVGYKLSPDYKISVAQAFDHSINEEPQSAENDKFSSRDPYVTLSLPSYTSSNERFNLGSYVRYYVPVSRLTRQTADSASPADAGRGAIRASIAPSYALINGKLNFSMESIFQYRLPLKNNAQRLAANGRTSRDDFYFILDPVLAYTLTDKLEVYGEYTTARMVHSTGKGKIYEGKSWNKFNNRSATGQSITAGLNWAASKKLLVNPTISSGPDFTGV